MRKLIILFFILLLIDISLFKYLDNLFKSLTEYQYLYRYKPLIYQNKDILLNDIDDFQIDDYFTILDFNDNVVDYSFDDNNTININFINYPYIICYDYSIIEPKYITKTEYITEKIYVQDNYLDFKDEHIYYQNDYYEFEIGTDLSYIIQIIKDDIESYTNVTCDYSKLNPYIPGEYEVFFYNDFEKIIKLIKIM